MTNIFLKGARGLKGPGVKCKPSVLVHHLEWASGSVRSVSGSANGASCLDSGLLESGRFIVHPAEQDKYWLEASLKGFRERCLSQPGLEMEGTEPRVFCTPTSG